MTLPFAHQRETRTEVIELPIEKLLPNPSQPRSVFEAQGLRELALSIEQHGILQPLSVRRVGNSYELIAGERRLRAAKLARLTVVPCIVVQVSNEESAILSLIENLQRRDLDFFEVAQGYQRLMKDYEMTQEQTALRVGKSQSAVANKLRLLRFSEDQMSFIRTAGLTERHCRSILRLPEEMFSGALEYIAKQGMTVAQTETYVENLILGEDESEGDINEIMPEENVADTDTMREKKPESNHTKIRKGKRITIVRDVRIFLNTIDRAFDIMRESGIEANCERRELDDYTELVIHIPKKRK